LFVGLFVYVFGSAMVIPNSTTGVRHRRLLTMILVTATPGRRWASAPTSRRSDRPVPDPPMSLTTILAGRSLAT
jgi:hypothetical protein